MFGKLIVPFAVVSALSLIIGCAAKREAPARSVSAAWESPANPDKPAVETAVPELRAPPPPRPSHAGSAIATVNGRAISFDRFEQLLMRSRGAQILDQLIALETVAAEAEAAGVSLSEADVGDEYERALRRLMDPLSAVNAGPADRERLDAFLDAVLEQRGVSREEFRLVMRRNAYLRKLVAADLRFTERELRSEFDRLYGLRAEVRHVQLASLGAVEQARSAIAEGVAFSDAARRFSANELSATRGGLLQPFAAEDPAVPEAFRAAAFALAPGGVSQPLRLGEWYHLIRLERIVAAEPADFDALRGEIERSLRDRRADEAMSERFQKLSRGASIEIHDAELAAVFERRGQRPRP